MSLYQSSTDFITQVTSPQNRSTLGLLFGLIVSIILLYRYYFQKPRVVKFRPPLNQIKIQKLRNKIAIKNSLGLSTSFSPTSDTAPVMGHLKNRSPSSAETPETGKFENVNLKSPLVCYR